MEYREQAKTLYKNNKLYGSAIVCLQYSPCGDEPGNIRDGHPQWNSI